MLLQLSIILLNAPKITAYNLPFNIFEFAQNLLAYVLIFPFFSLLDVNFITKSNYLLFAFITLVLFYFGVKQRRINKNHIYLSIGLIFCSLFSLIITLKAYPKFFYISQFEAFPSSFLKTRLLFYSLVFNYFLIFIFLDTFIKKIYKTRAKVFYFVLITVFININNPAFNTKDRTKNFPYVHYSLFSLAQFPQDEECLPVNPFPWLANTGQCNLLNFRQFSAFDEELMVLTLPYEFIVPSELLNKKIKYIHLLSKNHNDQTENIKNSIEITDSNNNIIILSPQIITDKIIRWKLPNPSKIIKINFKEIKSLSTVDKKPYVQLLGDPNEK